MNMKKALFILSLLALAALPLQAQDIVQSTAATLQSQAQESPQPAGSNANELKSSTAASLGDPATSAPANPANGPETKQSCQASLPAPSGDARKDD